MILFGRNLTQSEDPLQKLSVEQLYASIRAPKQQTINQIEQLRAVRPISNQQYNELKKRLPYFVCGIFNPAIRRKEHFGYTEYFVVDIDHISAKSINLEHLKQDLIQNQQVRLFFESPGKDGLKIMFKLKDRCYDQAIYSAFYKVFVNNLALKYNLEQVVDIKTSDVTRACFISFDPDAHYNKDSEPIDIQNYIDLNNPSEIFTIQKELRLTPFDTDAPKTTGEASKEALSNIKSILNPKLKEKQDRRNIYVPEELEQIIQRLRAHIEDNGIIIEDISNINYGKKIKMKVELLHSEINLFYGKRGFTVVQSPRCGTSSELNQLLASFIESSIDEILSTGLS